MRLRLGPLFVRVRERRESALDIGQHGHERHDLPDRSATRQVQAAPGRGDQHGHVERDEINPEQLRPKGKRRAQAGFTQLVDLPDDPVTHVTFVAEALDDAHAGDELDHPLGEALAARLDARLQPARAAARQVDEEKLHRHDRHRDPREDRVLGKEVDERRRADRDVDDERVAHVLEKDLDAVHVEGHLAGERARAFGRVIREREPLHLVDDEATQARDRGTHQALRVHVGRKRERAVDRQEREVGERVIPDVVEPMSWQNPVDEVAEAGGEGDMRDGLQGLPDSAPCDAFRLHAQERPEPEERAAVPRLRKCDQAGPDCHTA